jgi:NDP-sugar pyrophosphorylase family protein
MRQLIAQGEFSPVALTGVRWTDVDTPEDYATAELLLGAALRRRSSTAVEATVAA